MGLVFLPRIDRVAVIGEIRVGGICGKDRDKSRNIRKTVIPDAKQSEPMLADVEHSLTIEFVLLPMFQAIQKSIAIGGCERDPRFGGEA